MAGINPASPRCDVKRSCCLAHADNFMFILSTIADTFAQRLTKEYVRHDPSANARIRVAMLELLPPEGGDSEIDRLRHRLLAAPNATSLWFLRVNLHQQLTRSSGEQVAMQQVHALRHLFENAVPTSLMGPTPKQRRTVLNTSANTRVAPKPTKLDVEFS